MPQIFFELINNLDLIKAAPASTTLAHNLPLTVYQLKFILKNMFLLKPVSND